MTNDDNNGTKVPKSGTELDSPIYKFICSCKKAYKHRQGLYVHRKKCSFSLEETGKTDNDSIVRIVTAVTTETIKTLVATGNLVTQNQIQVNNEGNNHIGIQNNGHNFNIQLFLDKDCQNALSIQHFIKTLAITMNELSLLKNDEPKMIEGVIRKGLEGMPLTTRPMHAHQQEWYVKDEVEGWEKDSGEKLVTTIKAGVSKPLSALAAEHLPKFQTSESQSRQYAEAMQASFRDPSKSTIKKVLTNLKAECALNQEH